ncbi:hypothetical protein GOV07_04735 [Candidatus Woesearchaeota archaeon]|nr:hypothetical protein [Candidatus Woesearchaeota archaeon]
MTNANLVVDEATIKRKTTLSTVKVVNDFEAVGLAVKSLPIKSKKVLRKGTPDNKGVRVIVGPGTGLGVSILVDGKPIRSEGCQADFPIKSSDEYALLAYTREEEKWIDGTPVTYEDFLSGRGLERLYRFLRYTEFKARRDLQYRYSAKEISETRTTNPCSKLAFLWFERFLGRRCKNLALDAYTTGGIWLAGGIIAKNPDMVGKAFLMELGDHPLAQYRAILDKLPVTLVIDENAGLIGAAVSIL